MSQGASGERRGAIILARHGRPALSRRVLLSAEQYRAWWARYEEQGLKPGQDAPDELRALARDACEVIASTRPRSVESAQITCGERAFVTEETFIEAPLPPPRWPALLRLPPIVWGFISRVNWWFFGPRSGQESRREAEIRAEAAAARLEAAAQSGGDVLVLAHGFFNAMVARALRRRGWRLTANGGYAYWAARRFEKRS